MTQPSPDPTTCPPRPAQPPAAGTHASWRSPLALTLSLITGRWVLPVLDELATGPKRHTELKDTIEGISEKVLTQTLRRMERDGLITRQLGLRTTHHVLYQNTTLGRSLDLPLKTLAKWQDTHWEQITQTRAQWDHQEQRRSRLAPKTSMKSGWHIGAGSWRARAQQAKRSRYAELRQMGHSPSDAVRTMGMAGRGSTPGRYEHWYQHQLPQTEPDQGPNSRPG